MRNLSRVAILGFAASLGCAILAPPPDVIAGRFWDATLDGDFERAGEYVTQSSADLLERQADGARQIEEVTLGDVEIDGDEATVQTRLVATVNDRPTEIEFQTVMEREDGQWRVDLRRTSGQMIANLLGGAAGEIMGQLGEVLGEQMRGMFDGLIQGLSQGLQEASQALQEARPDSTR